MLRCGLIVFKLCISFLSFMRRGKGCVCMYVCVLTEKVSDNKSSKAGMLPCPTLVVVKSFKGKYSFVACVIKYAHVVDLSDLQ